ncbi:MAG: ADP-forming succinate--CoA ligase subunit beta [Clostridia bacterium]|nr:ADP-forming succinate--CoA ligase subunit beta [Clostridia bacterium]
MKVHEYQAAALMAEYGVPVPSMELVFSAEEAEEAAYRLGGGPYVVKAQIHSGGRGKAGGVKFAETPGEVRQCAQEILGKTLVTRQTGPKGRLVRRAAVARTIDIRKEYYLSLTVDGASERVVMIASSMGGMDIEQTAAEAPESILRVAIDPMIGLRSYQSRLLADGLGLSGPVVRQFIPLAASLYRLFRDKDCSLIEINPLVLDGEDRLIAADAKINFDDNALARHPDIAALRDADEEDPREVKASGFGLNYVQMDGSIGCMVNGAGLAMATMDIIQANGGSPANFLDVGGSATEERVSGAFSILLSDANVRGIFVNIFGGIMRCDIIAAGIVSATRKLSVRVPLVVRLEGTNAEAGKRILEESGLRIVPADDMADGARKICRLVREEGGCA